MFFTFVNGASQPPILTFSKKNIGYVTRNDVRILTIPHISKSFHSFRSYGRINKFTHIYLHTFVHMYIYTYIHT